MAENAGTKVVFLTYPRRIADVHETIVRSATAAECLLVDMTQRFETFMKGGSYSEYFIPDGHPNDKGYKIYGRSVFDAILQLKKTPPAETAVEPGS